MSAICHSPSLRRRAGGLLLALLVPISAVAAGRCDPALGPTEVVHRQLQALAHNDQPYHDAGIATVYALASPANRRVTGPLPRFAALIHAHYADLIDNRRFVLAAPRVARDRAVQPAVVIAADGVIHQFLFLVSRQQQDAWRGCWMTDAVLSEDAARSAPSTL